MITVLLADDHIYVRNLLQLLLERAGDIQIVAVALNGQEAVEKAALYHPDVVVMDVSMPVLDGIEATKQIRANHPEARVLMLSMHDSPNYIGHCLQAGALGYVLKETAGNELVTAIHSIHQDAQYFSKKIAEVAQRFVFNRGKLDAPPSVASSL